jgi:AcrR family transcriptional regulator
MTRKPSRAVREPPVKTTSPDPPLKGAAARRFAIARAAIKLFSERGLDATTIDEIAAEAGVSPRTFFRHFPSKEEAAFPDHEDRIAELRRQLATRRPAVSPLHVAIEVSRRSAHEYLENPDLYRPRIQLFRANHALRERERITDQEYEDVLADYLEVEFADDPSALLKGRVIAAAIVAAVNHAVDQWAADPAVDGERLLEEALEFVEDAFAPLVRPGTVARDEDVVVVVASSPKLRAELGRVLGDARPPSAHGPVGRRGRRTG